MYMYPDALRANPPTCFSKKLRICVGGAHANYHIIRAMSLGGLRPPRPPMYTW